MKKLYMIQADAETGVPSKYYFGRQKEMQRLITGIEQKKTLQNVKDFVEGKNVEDNW